MELANHLRSGSLKPLTLPVDNSQETLAQQW